MPAKVIHSRSVSKKVFVIFISGVSHVAIIHLQDQGTVTADWYKTIPFVCCKSSLSFEKPAPNDGLSSTKTIYKYWSLPVTVLTVVPRLRSPVGSAIRNRGQGNFHPSIMHKDLAGRAVRIPVVTSSLLPPNPECKRSREMVFAAIRLHFSDIRLHPQGNTSTSIEFQQNRSTIDAIFVLRQIVEKTIELNAPAFMCFVDLQKGFHRVKLGDMMGVLQEKDAPRKLIHIILALI
ncbi:hypothetical protein Trydic_g16149 [Trypoxylus dichotomus]